jgi:hypothetical protein
MMTVHITLKVDDDAMFDLRELIMNKTNDPTCTVLCMLASDNKKIVVTELDFRQEL